MGLHSAQLIGRLFGTRTLNVTMLVGTSAPFTFSEPVTLKDEKALVKLLSCLHRMNAVSAQLSSIESRREPFAHM